MASFRSASVFLASSCSKRSFSALAFASAIRSFFSLSAANLLASASANLFSSNFCFSIRSASRSASMRSLLRRSFLMRSLSLFSANDNPSSPLSFLTSVSSFTTLLVSVSITTSSSVVLNSSVYSSGKSVSRYRVSLFPLSGTVCTSEKPFQPSL